MAPASVDTTSASETIPASETGPASQTGAERRRARWRQARGWAVEAAVFLALLGVLGLWRTRGAVSGAAPALAGTASDGAFVSLAQERGHAVLVHFWGSWCPVCRTEEGSIDALARDVPLVTVASTSGDAATIGRYLQQNGRAFRALPDPDGRIAGQWGVAAFPTTFVLGPDGAVRFVTSGWTTGLGLRARLWLAGL
jgi:thiol-disulfide isomerase/thioredoxin